MLKPGDKAPEFSAPDQNGTMHSLKDYRGRKVVLYFYPKDMTPGCTVEACNFRDNLERVQGHGAEVIGVSPDPVKRHGKFAARQSLNFTLISDEDTSIAQAYSVWTEKSMFGLKFLGVQRATFIIDEKGMIEKIFPKVRVLGHVQEVIDALAD